MEQLISYVPTELGILVAALWVIGYFVKNTNKVPDAYIPFILIVLGIIGAISLNGLSTLSILQGIICAAVAVLGKNLIKQGSEIIQEISTEQKEQ